LSSLWGTAAILYLLLGIVTTAEMGFFAPIGWYETVYAQNQDQDRDRDQTGPRP
jgi:hypothetical protein